MDAASTPDSECPKHLTPVSREENAPEVSPSSAPILAHQEHEEKQVARDDSPKFLTPLNKISARAFGGYQSRYKRKVWILTSACAIFVVVLTTSIVLGVHFGKRNDNANDTTASASSIISATPTSSTTMSQDSTTRASSSSLATSVALSTSNTVSYSTTVTVAATSATPTDAAADDLGCYEQGNPDKQIPLCAQPACPSGYRSVFWDFGCPDGRWKCCI